MKTEHEYSFDLKDRKATARTMLQAMKDSLVVCMRSTSKLKELEWEIRLYDYMLEDPETRLSQYQKVRRIMPGVLIPKREVVKRLGWVVL